MARALSKPGALATWGGVALLIIVMMVFTAIRLTSDVPHLLSGTVPGEGEFDRRYVENPVLAYLHILPGVVYLVAAPLQLWARFRNRHLGFHRKLGRVLVVAGLLSGVFAIAFGLLHPFGGWVEASAATVFGIYFITALSTAYRSIRSGNQTRHRRWMIRAFAVALGVGTIRFWIGLFEALGMLEMDDSFGLAFWIAFLMHAAAAELWLWRRPT